MATQRPDLERGAVSGGVIESRKRVTDRAVLEAEVPAYRDGWLPGSWRGFPDTLSDPAPWHFRTLGSWLALFAEAGLAPVMLREPLHPDSNRPASALFIAGRTDNAKM